MHTPIISTGIQSLDALIGGWKPACNYVVAGGPAMGMPALTITMAYAFAQAGGKLIWIGHYEDLHQASLKFVLRQAGIKHCESFDFVGIEEHEFEPWRQAHRRVCSRDIDLFDIDDYGNEEIERKFFSQIETYKPTWIVIEPSIFDRAEKSTAEFDESCRRLNLLLGRIQKTNPNSSVLWQLNLPGRIDGRNASRPVLDDIMDPVQIENAEVVMLTYRKHADNSNPILHGQAELIIAKNDFGDTGSIDMIYESDLSTWRESAMPD